MNRFNQAPADGGIKLRWILLSLAAAYALSWLGNEDYASRRKAECEDQQRKAPPGLIASARYDAELDLCHTSLTPEGLQPAPFRSPVAPQGQ